MVCAMQEQVTVVANNHPFIQGAYCHRISLEAHFLFPDSNMGYNIHIGNENPCN